MSTMTMMVTKSPGKTSGRGAAKSPGSWFKAHNAYLRSNKWKAKKATWYRKNGKWCRVCSTKKDIQLHHLTYDRLGNELLTDLTALCQKHHKALTDEWRLVRRSRKMDLRTFSRMFIKRESLKLIKGKK
jgi:hypothetical protein